MTSNIAAFVAVSALLCACASPDDDSWAGAAGEDGEGGEGGSGGAKTSGSSSATKAVSATTAPATSTVAQAATTVTTGTSGCDVGDCGTCQSCAMSGICADEVDACFNDAECYAFLECLQNCVDEACANDCANAHPTGVNLYIVASDCVFCTGCPVTCGAC
jgi:hypothetical protein